MSLSKILTEDFLTCIICEERYEEPKILPCVHSFCKRCLEGHVKVRLDPDRHFPCPICRRECKLPEKGPDDLEKNRLIANLAEILDKIQKAKTQMKCEVCALREPPVDADATKRCLNCDDNMCDVCSAEHRRHGGCRDHKIIPMAQLNDEEYANVLRSRQQTLCNHDNKSPAEVFCLDCKKFICGTCVSLQHKDHDCKYIPEAATGGKDRLNAVVSGIDEQAKMIEKLCSDLMIQKTGQQDRGVKIKKLITEREIKVQELIKTHADRMRKEVDEFTSQTTDELTPIEKEIELLQGCFASFKEFTNALLIHGSDAEILQTMANCLERGRELMQMEIPTIPTPQCLTLDVNQVNNMSAVLRGCMGEVRQARDNKELMWSFSVKLTTDPEEWITHVAVDAEGHLCVGVWCNSDKKRNKINIYDDGRRLMTTLPGPKNGYFAGIAFDQDGNIVARSQVNNSVMIFNKDGKHLSSFPSPQPRAVIVNSEGQYIIAGRNAIYIHDKNGKIVKSIPDALQGNDLKYVAVSITGDILVSHPGAHKVLAYDQVSGDLKFTYGTYGSGDGQVNYLLGMCCLANGDIILVDGGNSRLHLISSDGVFKKYLLTEDDGLKCPEDVALTPDGNLVVVEQKGMVKCFCLLN